MWAKVETSRLARREERRQRSKKLATIVNNTEHSDAPRNGPEVATIADSIHAGCAESSGNSSNDDDNLEVITSSGFVKCGQANNSAEIISESDIRGNAVADTNKAYIFVNSDDASFAENCTQTSKTHIIIPNILEFNETSTEVNNKSPRSSPTLRVDSVSNHNRLSVGRRQMDRMSAVFSDGNDSNQIIDISCSTPKSDIIV